MKWVYLAFFFSVLGFPVAENTRLEKGNHYFNEGKYREALREYNQALAQKENPTLSRFYKANTLYKLGQFGRAVTLYRHTIDLAPDFLRAYINLGSLYFQLDEIPYALDIFHKAQKMEPENLALIKMLGECYLKIEQFEKAIFYFEKGQQLERHNIEWVYAIVEVYQMLDDLTSIEYTLESHLDDFDQANLFFLLGDIQYSMGKKAEAGANYNRGLGKDPSRSIYYYKLAAIQTENKKPFLAISTLNSGVSRGILKPEAHLDIAGIFIDLEDYPEAVKHYEQAFLNGLGDGLKGVLYCLEFLRELKDEDTLESIHSSLAPKLSQTQEVRAFFGETCIEL